MGSKKISELTPQTDIIASDLLMIETAGGASRKTTPAKIFSTITESLLPIGSILDYGGLTAPTGYLLCNGASISKSTYASLYAVLSAELGECTISNASPCIVTLNGHGLVTGDLIFFTTSSADLPASLAENTNYYVVYIDANTFNIASTYANAIAGTKINTSDAGSGTHTLHRAPYGVASATNFYLPDFKAASSRGSGLSTVFTEDVTVPMGSYIDDQMQTITGSITTSAGPGLLLAPAANITAAGCLTHADNNGQAFVSPVSSTRPRTLSFNSATSPNARTGVETRIKTVGVNKIIKY